MRKAPAYTSPQYVLHRALTSFPIARPAGEMVGWEVNREYVCDPERDGPECMAPVAGVI